MSPALQPEMLAGLLQLASATLPIGAYSHSLGLEAAVDARCIRDAASAQRWIGDHMEYCWARGEAPLWLALFDAWEHADLQGLSHWNDRVLAMRESQEMLLECTQTGHSLRLWLLALPGLDTLNATARATLAQLQPVAYLCVHALAARALRLPAAVGLHAAAWSLLENLSAAAVKLIPLGQTAGQTLLRQLSLRLPALIERAQSHHPATASNFAPMLAILSAQHESQYSRLFRS